MDCSQGLELERTYLFNYQFNAYNILDGVV